MGGFTKLFSTITASTVWMESDQTRIVWITMLAMADQYGQVMASVPGLAHMARVPIEATREALERFLSPDPDSRTPDHDGRRIEKIDGGWALLNYGRYREARNKDERREYLRDKKREERQQKRQQVSTSVNNSQQCQPPSTQAEAEAEAITPPTPSRGDDVISPAMVAQGVCSEARIAGRWLLVDLERVCKSELDAGADATELRDSMVKAWGEYQRFKPRLQFQVGAEKFFGQGVWKNMDGWPWKIGESPPPKGKRNADALRAQSVLKEMDDAREKWERQRAEEIREPNGIVSG